MLKLCVGASSESENVPFIPGMAHFLEHLLFKNEDLHNSDPLTELGVDSNAYTDYEKCAFHFSGAAQSLAAVRQLVRMVFSPAFTQQQISEEREVVLAEMRDALADPEEYAEFEFRSRLFDKPNYSCDILGTPCCLNKLNTEIIGSYHREFYRPAGAVLVLAGKRSTGELTEAITDLVNLRNRSVRFPDFRIETADLFYAFQRPPAEQTARICGFGRVERQSSADTLQARINAQIFNELAFQQSFAPFRKLYSRGVFNKTLRLITEFERGYQMIAVQQAGGEDGFGNAAENLVKMISDGCFRESELRRAVKSAAGQIALEFRNPATTVEFLSDIYLLGLGLDRLDEALESVCRDSMMRFCADISTHFKFHSFQSGGKR